MRSGQLAGADLERLQPVGGLEQIVPARREPVGEDRADVGVVVDD